MELQGLSPTLGKKNFKSARHFILYSKAAYKLIAVGIPSNTKFGLNFFQYKQFISVNRNFTWYCTLNRRQKINVAQQPQTKTNSKKKKKKSMVHYYQTIQSTSQPVSLEMGIILQLPFTSCDHTVIEYPRLVPYVHDATTTSQVEHLPLSCPALFRSSWLYPLD